jgi:mannose-6-phosphate isomerase-like protein (cupin superfamily)
MIRPGQTIENSLTGEVLTFHKTARDTGGEYVLVETLLPPGATGAAAHSHPHQSESYYVLDGRLGIEIGHEKLQFGAGDGVTLLPRTPHNVWNAGVGDVRFTCEVRPAGAFETQIELLFDLAAARKPDKAA